MSTNSSLRVAHVIAPGPVGGAEQVVVRGVAALRADGVDAHLAILDEWRAPVSGPRFAALAESAGVPYTMVPVRRRVDPGAGRTLRVALANADLVHAHGFKSVVYARAARPRTPLVVTDHGVTRHTRSVRAYESMAQAMMRYTAGVFAVAHSRRESLIAAGVPADRIVVVENMLTRGLAPLPAPSNSVPQLLFVGRLSPEKGVDVLLRSLAKLGSPAQLTIVGDGPARDPLVALSERLGLAASVEFVGFQAEVQPYFERADLLVLPSRREGLPLALLEAAASARPAVATRVGAAAEVIRDGHNGLLAVPGCVTSLRRALTSALARLPALLAGAQAHAAQVIHRFSPARWALETQRGYHVVLAGGAMGND